MVKILIKSVLYIGLFWMILGHAQPTDLYVFDSDHQRQAFIELTQQLRCLVCQNENLADSTAPLAQDLRADIYRKIRQGWTADQIQTYLLNRYGQFILFKPKLTWGTAVLWCAPFIFLLVAIGMLVRQLLRKRSVTSDL